MTTGTSTSTTPVGNSSLIRKWRFSGVVPVLLWVSLGIVLLFISMDSMARWMTVEKISAVTFSEVKSGSVPIPPGSREEMIVLPDGLLDARWWVLHTQSMLMEGKWRVRHTSLDNAGPGREVHWSSLLMWLLGGMAWVMSLTSEWSAVDLVSTAALYVGPLLLSLFTVGLAWMVGKRWSLHCALFFAVSFLSTVTIYKTFQAGEADHHGLVTGFALGSVIALMAGGAGLVKQSGKKHREAVADLLTAGDSKVWFRISGVLGACALWVSAATAIPIIAGIAAGAVLLTWFATRIHEGQWHIEPSLWSVWAGWGACASIVLYLIEYFPDSMGWRLEVNHPLHAFAWWGGGVWLTWVCGKMANQSDQSPSTNSPWKLGFATLWILIPLIMVTRNSDQFFWVRDPFLLALHDQYIMEFQSLPAFMSSSGNYFGWLAHYVLPLMVIISAACFLIWRQRDRVLPAIFLLLVPAIVVMQGLAVYQVRWASGAFVLWVAAATLGFVYASAINARWVRGILVATVVYNVVFLLGAQSMVSVKKHETALDSPIPESIGSDLLMRDIAHRLLQSSPTATPVVLAGPNSSTQMAYHGRIHTLGTLYWENMPGLKAAAEIFSTTAPDQVLELMQARGVTHIVIPSWEDFGNAYASLYALENSDLDPEVGATFFKAICEGELAPQWLRPFAYPISAESGMDTTSVRIFAVLPTQNAFEAAFFYGIYHFEVGEWSASRTYFENAQTLRPNNREVSGYLAAIQTRMQPNEEM